MNYSINYSKKAIKSLKKLPLEITKRLDNKIEQLSQEPVPHDSKAIIGFVTRLFRVRVGDYRILYEVDHTHRLISIVKVDKRAKASF